MLTAFIKLCTLYFNIFSFLYRLYLCLGQNRKKEKNEVCATRFGVIFLLFGVLYFLTFIKRYFFFL